MKRLLRLIGVVSCTLATVGCLLFLSKETRYLRSATDRASQEDVRRYLGPPAHVTSKTGETLWVYRIRNYVEGGNNAWTMVGTWWCDEYVLRFDDREILRHWTHTSQRC
jgi:hypothetical protein